MHTILLNNRRRSSSEPKDLHDETFTMDETVGEDDIFNQMKEADEEAKQRHGDDSTAPTVCP